MDYKKIGKQLLPHVIIILLFVGLTAAYFSPVLEGKDLPQMDTNHATGMAKEVDDFKAATGEDTRWTNSAFSGMPAYQIRGGESRSIFAFLVQIFRLNLPYFTLAIAFSYLMGFYILLTSLKFNPWVSFAGAVAFAFASYNFIIIPAGHVTKAHAIAFMAPVVAGFILTYQKKYLAGGLLTTIFLGIEIGQNHMQITYYLMMLVGVLVIAQFIQAIKDKLLPDFAKATAVAALAVILAVLPNFTNLWVTYEYSKETIRGKSELTDSQENKSSGLDKDYALAWSYGVAESWSLLVPNVKGGGSGYIGQSEKAMEKVNPQYREFIAQQNHYWGDQPFTSGPVYAGAIICFLFVLGLLIVRGHIKWWLLAATVLSLFLSWGKNMEWFTDIFFYYVPFYNKFRTVSMALVIASLTIPLMAMYALQEIWKTQEVLKKYKKEFFIAFGITGGLSLIFWLMPGVLFSFLSGQEANYFAGLADDPQYAAQLKAILPELEKARIAILKADAGRSLIFILLAATVIYVYSLKKIKREVLISILILLILVDVWTVAKRYLNNEQFKPKRSVENPFQPSRADEFILKDSDPYYRVLNMNNPFNEVKTSYFHNSIGGYHGAKLRRYQELIDYHITSEMQQIQKAFKDENPMQAVNALLPELGVLNMLNTKYIIYNPESFPIVNMNAIGNAWFVNEFKFVENADEEIKELGNINPRNTALIDKRFKDVVGDFTVQPDSVQSLIKLTIYKPNHLTFQLNAKKDELAVFSDMYYDKGWKAYIDGKETEHFRVNYVLRGMIVPSGNHLIEFKFEPRSYNLGQIISLIGSILVGLFIVIVIAKYVIDARKQNA